MEFWQHLVLGLCLSSLCHRLMYRWKPLDILHKMSIRQSPSCLLWIWKAHKSLSAPSLCHSSIWRQDGSDFLVFRVRTSPLPFVWHTFCYSRGKLQKISLVLPEELQAHKWSVWDVYAYLSRCSFGFPPSKDLLLPSCFCASLKNACSLWIVPRHLE